MEMKEVTRHQDERSILITGLPLSIRLKDPVFFIRLIKTLIKTIYYSLIENIDSKLKKKVTEIT